MTTPVHTQAQIVWDYHLLNHPLEKGDCLLVLCSNDIRVAEYAAQLFLEGYAPFILFSGGVGPLTEDLFERSEAEAFAQIAADMGVPEHCILIEPQSTNTGENIQFSRALLEEKGLDPDRMIVVQKPFMERRSYATMMRLWPDKSVVVTSPPLSFDDYPNEQLSYSDVINVMVGDLQRLMHYALLGYAVPQDIPTHVSQAFQSLVALGFNEHLLESDPL
ncbi:YdcF family protein [Photobacterium atrarenae]|uniref:YdcF family protein n=1 Tax=Photobacterium atrarenae TaxID=865757 RepID=A0ABY5GM79_9GAMM|nr:YdcF family protein [Photobacterium atrarenae]UTV30209.1 YdcF family protein [Photobacterium atrarenae]